MIQDSTIRLLSKLSSLLLFMNMVDILATFTLEMMGLIVELMIFLYLLHKKMSWQKICMMVITMYVAASLMGAWIGSLMFLILHFMDVMGLFGMVLAHLSQITIQVFMQALVAQWHLKTIKTLYNLWIIRCIIAGVCVSYYIVSYYILYRWWYPMMYSFWLN